MARQKPRAYAFWACISWPLCIVATALLGACVVAGPSPRTAPTTAPAPLPGPQTLPTPTPSGPPPEVETRPVPLPLPPPATPLQPGAGSAAPAQAPVAAPAEGAASGAPAPPLVPTTDTIALVLPLQSALYGRAAEAVKAGFLAAANAGGESARVKVIGYGDDGVLPAVAAATEGGAALVVGPLTRDDL